MDQSSEKNILFKNKPRFRNTLRFDTTFKVSFPASLFGRDWTFLVYRPFIYSRPSNAKLKVNFATSRADCILHGRTLNRKRFMIPLSLSSFSHWGR